jgi:hypothetical protein
MKRVLILAVISLGLVASGAQGQRLPDTVVPESYDLHDVFEQQLGLRVIHP